ncbi:hypothetical protein C8R46DRAFT_1128289 [Mycena filopes]|nr:hypothetical protein C8R46DRAFT_1128289 [Mycena filopes]
MLDEQSGMALGKAYEAILAMVVFSLVRQLKLPQTTGSELLQHKFRNYLQTSKLDVCITSALERPKFGTVEWGVTNRNETLEEDYGLLFPAINGGLVDQYESFCNDKSPLSGQLGFLIVVTYIHELGRTWLRHVSTTKIPPFWTTSTLIRSQDAESGRLLESLLLGGDLRVAWKTDADCRSVDRFTKIDAIWLRLSYSTDYPQYRRLNPYALTYFHNVILGEDAVDLQFLLTNIATAASNPAVDLRELEMRGPLLRVAPQSTSPQTSYENSSCSIGLGLRFEGYCGMHQ